MLGNSAFSQQGATKPKIGDILKKTAKTIMGIQNPAYGAASLMSSAIKKQMQPAQPQAAVAPAPNSTISQGNNSGMINKPSTPVKSVTTADGTKTEYHAPAVDNQKQTPVSTQKQTPIDTQSNARRVIEAGAPTTGEKTAVDRLYQAGQATPMEQTYIDRIQKAQGMKNAGMLGGYAEAGMYKDQTPEQLYGSLVNAPDLVGRADASKGLYDAFSNIYGSQATQGLLAANTIAGRGLTAAQSGLTGAQTQAQRAQGGATDVLGAGLPAQAPYTNYRYDPLTGETIGGGANPFEGGAQAGLVALGQQYPALQSAHVQSKGIKNTIQDYLGQNPGLNPSDVSLVNSALQWAQGKQLGDPRYQTLVNYLNEYTNTLAPILGVGGDPTNLKTEIANSFVNAAASGQSISQVLDNIDSLAESKLQSMANVGAGNNTPASASNPVGSSGGNMFGSFFGQ